MQVRPPVVPPPAEALPEPEIYVRLAEAMGLFGPPPAELRELAPRRARARRARWHSWRRRSSSPRASRASPRSACCSGPTARSARTCPRRRSRRCAAVAPERHAPPRERAAHARREWEGKARSRSARRSSAASSPIPKASRSRASDPRPQPRGPLGFADGKIRLAPEPMIAEIAPRGGDGARGRSRVSARARRRPAHALDGEHDPARSRVAEGRGPALRAQSLARRCDDARRARRRHGARVHAPRRADAAGADRLEAAWPATSGCRTASACGVRRRASDRRRARNQNELTDVADRDPFTGIPHHRYVRCRVERA